MPGLSSQKFGAVLLVLALGSMTSAMAGAASSAALAAPTGAKAPSPGLTPQATLKAFDSLMDAGRYEQARPFCAGQVLRMFDFMVKAQAKLAGLMDTARTHEETLEEKSRGDWAYVKMSSGMIFKRPFLGQDSLHSIQAYHLYHSRRGWLITEMEELDGPQTPVQLRSGTPEGLAESDSAAARLAAGGANPGAKGKKPGADARPIAAPDSGAETFFPISPRAPAVAGAADRLRYRLSLKHGGSLASLCALGPEQVLMRAESPSQWVLENRRRVLADSRPRAGAGRKSMAGASAEPKSVSGAGSGAAAGKPAATGASTAALPALPDSLKPYLASDTYLDLSDSLLRATAATLAPGSSDPNAIAEAAYHWVLERFRFQLGSVLFGTSRETLRALAGDCSEAAILTAALLRARGVPARVTLGFATLGRGVFIGHAWCEAFLSGGWTGVDAALREYPAGIERVALARLDGSLDMRIAATNLMMSVLSNLEIEILAAWKDGKSLPLDRCDGNASEAKAFFDDLIKGMGSAPQ